MPHDHFHLHHHVRRDWVSDLDSFLGIGGDDSSTAQGDPVSIVYVTESATFSGAIGGYVTASNTEPVATGKGDPVQQSTHTSHTHAAETDTASTSTKKATAHPTSTTSVATITSAPSTTTFSTAAATTTSLTASSVLSNDMDQASVSSTAFSTTSATPTTAASSSGGLSGGAKAGIAIGVLLGLAVIAGLALFWLHRQKKNREEAAQAEAVAAEREKSYPPNNAPMTNSSPAMTYASKPSTPSTAPQVSLRPVTQFNPLLNHSGENAIAAGTIGAALGAAAGAGVAASNQNAGRAYNGSAHSPPTPDGRQNPFNDPVNPFDHGAQAASPPPPIAKDAPVDATNVRELTPSPTGSSSGIPATLAAGKSPVQPEAITEGVAAGAVVGAAAAAAATVVAANQSDEPTGQRTPSPEYREGSPDSAMGSRPQSPSVGGGPFSSNVHRVQMDFVPSLADEMEMRAGQLVRILKTYDDGWAQCSSMDGSIKGIAPRSCLSARPLQPRRPPGPGQGPPRGPPPMGPNGRPMSPAGGRMGPPPPNGAPPRFYQDGRPRTPTQRAGPQFPAPPSAPRSMSPAPRASADMPRPLTPGGSSRPGSPVGGRQRSNSSSVAQTGRPAIAVTSGPSPLAPPTGPLPGPPSNINNRPQSPIGRKPVPGAQ